MTKRIQFWNWHVKVMPVKPSDFGKASPVAQGDFEAMCQHYRTHDIYIAATNAELAMLGAQRVTRDGTAKVPLVICPEGFLDLEVVYLQRKEPVTVLGPDDVDRICAWCGFPEDTDPLVTRGGELICDSCEKGDESV